MTEFTPIASTVGGLLIGLASAIMLVFNGRIAGISGILGGAIDGRAAETSWRRLFLVGLLLGGAASLLVAPSAFGHAPVSTPLVVVAGLLVGFGTRLGSGCTSGHGVCGISRMSGRSLVATATFMAAGFTVVYLVRHLGS